MASALRILRAIHDFLPRHQAGSEIYAHELGRAQSVRHHVTILCADYDPSRRHGHVTWRVHGGLPVVEIVNNWVGGSFADSYRCPPSDVALWARYVGAIAAHTRGVIDEFEIVNEPDGRWAFLGSTSEGS